MTVNLYAPTSRRKFLRFCHSIILSFFVRLDVEPENEYKNNSQRTFVLLRGCPEDDTILPIKVLVHLQMYVKPFGIASTGRFFIYYNLDPFLRLQRQQSVCRLSSVVNPPLETGIIWSISSRRFGSC